MIPVPDALLDGIAARPDEPGVWEVLTDYLLEHDAPGATLARCDLELFKGISNPDLLGTLAEARAQRPRLPFEPLGGFDAMWRCGYVVKLQASTRMPGHQLEQVLRAQALAGLHHLRFEDQTPREGRHTYLELISGDERPLPIGQRLAQICSSVTPHLRRFSLHLERRTLPLLPADLSSGLDSLAACLPSKVERVDLSLTELGELSLDALIGLAKRVQLVNLDGTKLNAVREAALQRLFESAPTTKFILGGTGLSSRTVIHPRVEWLASDALAWLEDQHGAYIPLTPERPHDGFESPSWLSLGHYLKRDLMGWQKHDGSLLGERALLLIDGEVWKFNSVRKDRRSGRGA
jgi:hypothetical protein